MAAVARPPGHVFSTADLTPYKQAPQIQRRTCITSGLLRDKIELYTHQQLKALIEQCEPRLRLFQRIHRLVAEPPPPHIYIIVGATSNWYTLFRIEAKQKQDDGMLDMLGKRVFLLDSIEEVNELVLSLREDDGDVESYNGKIHVLFATNTALDVHLPDSLWQMMPLKLHGWKDDGSNELVHALYEPIQFRFMGDEKLNELVEDVRLVAQGFDNGLEGTPLSPGDVNPDCSRTRASSRGLSLPATPRGAPSTPRVMSEARALEEARLDQPSPVPLATRSPYLIPSVGHNLDAASLSLSNLRNPPANQRNDVGLHDGQLHDDELHNGSLHDTGEAGERAFYVHLNSINRRLSDRDKVGEVKAAILDSGLGQEPPRGRDQQLQRVRSVWKNATRCGCLQEFDDVDRVGHGTSVATLFLRACPFAKLSAYKVVKDVRDTHTGGFEKPSANAKAVAEVSHVLSIGCFVYLPLSGTKKCPQEWGRHHRDVLGFLRGATRHRT